MALFGWIFTVQCVRAKAYTSIDPVLKKGGGRVGYQNNDPVYTKAIETHLNKFDDK